MKKREWLIAYRRAKCLTQEEIANAIDVSESTYSAYEMGVRTPKPKTAKKIANIFNFDWTKFYEQDIQDKTFVEKLEEIQKESEV